MTTSEPSISRQSNCTIWPSSDSLDGVATPLSGTQTRKNALKQAKKLARNQNKSLSAPTPDDVNSAAPQTQPQSSIKSATLSLTKIAVLIISQLPLYAASPISGRYVQKRADEAPAEESDSFWVNMGISVFLVMMGGIFAGLTLGLMGQDEVYLQVIQQTGEEAERKAAGKVLSLLKRGKHWVLVTLLLSNVITNESLPIVLDRSLGGGWPAVVSSTAAIVIFGEIIPQSASVRYGLGIGAAFAPFVVGLMYLMYPVAYPVALLLDYILGEDHGTIYKRAGLKSLVGLHKTMGVERLSDDEVTIITAVLDLKDKPVHRVMTPMDDVFTMSSDRVLNEETIEEILHTGFNRIPIHAPGEPTNFIGMLLVRTLITYDPEDAFPISSFPLATLPETKPDTSCLNILNYFQEGKSHMIVVSLTPGAPSGALGVLTLEDVIEELIGEEIIDESDVYVDVHRAIKRTQPGPLKRVVMHSSFVPRSPIGFENVYHALVAQDGLTDPSVKPKLNPLNKASNPKQTTNSKVTIKPAVDVHAMSPKTVGNDINGQLLASPNGNYGTIHRTEQGAVDEVIMRSGSLDPNYGQHLKVPNGEGSNNFNTNTNINNNNNQDQQQYVVSPSPELHSYRTGGIIESVVNVQGVSKTIIEDTASSLNGGGGGSGTYNGGENGGRISSTSSMSSRWSKKSDEEHNLHQPLLR